MPRYIDAEKFRVWLRKQKRLSKGYTVQMLDETSTADVQEVRHGRNVTDMHPVDEFVCSECGIIIQDFCQFHHDDDTEDEWYSEFEFKYCPTVD